MTKSGWVTSGSEALAALWVVHLGISSHTHHNKHNKIKIFAILLKT